MEMDVKVIVDGHELNYVNMSLCLIRCRTALVRICIQIVVFYR